MSFAPLSTEDVHTIARALRGKQRGASPNYRGYPRNGVGPERRSERPAAPAHDTAPPPQPREAHAALMPTNSQTTMLRSHSEVGAREREMLSTLAVVFTDVVTDVVRTELGGMRNELAEVKRLLQGTQEVSYTSVRLQWQSIQKMEEMWDAIEEWGKRYLPPNQEKDLCPPSSPSNTRLESRKPPQSVHTHRMRPLTISNPQPPTSNPNASTSNQQHHASNTQHQAANPQPHPNTQSQYAADPPPFPYAFSPANPPSGGEDESLRNLFDQTLLPYIDQP